MLGTSNKPAPAEVCCDNPLSPALRRCTPTADDLPLDTLGGAVEGMGGRGLLPPLVGVVTLVLLLLGVTEGVVRPPAGGPGVVDRATVPPPPDVLDDLAFGGAAEPGTLLFTDGLEGLATLDVYTPNNQHQQLFSKETTDYSLFVKKAAELERTKQH